MKNKKDKNNQIESILGFGEFSARKNYYSELQKSIQELQAREAAYKSFLETSPDAIVVCDLTGVVIYCNPKFVEIHSLENAEEWLNKSALELVSDEDRPRALETIQLIISEGLQENLEFNLLRKDGSKFPAEISGNLIYGGDNKPQNLLIISRDITERKRSEEALKRSEDRLSKIMLAANDGTWDWDLISNTVFFDQRWFAMAGYEVNEFPHRLEEFQKRVHPDDIEGVMYEAQKHIEGNTERYRAEFRFRKKDDSWLYILARGFIVERDSSGKPTRFIGIHSDISERKKAQEALYDSESKYRSLIENSNDAIYLLHNRRFEIINQKFSKLFGYSIDEVNSEGFDFINLVSEKSRAIIEERMKKAAKGEKLDPKYEFVAVSKDGKEIFCEVNTTYIDYKDGIATQGIIRDITDRVKSEEEVRKLSRAVEQSPVSVIITDIEGRIEYANPKFTSVTGYDFEEVRGKNPRIFKSGNLSDEKYKELWETINSGLTWKGEFRNKRKSGELFWELASISPIKNNNGEIKHFIAIKEDITQRKEIEELLINREKFIKGISDASPAIIYVYDLVNNENVYLNQTIERILGYSVDEIRNIGTSFFPTMTHPDDLQVMIEHFEKIKFYCADVLNSKKTKKEFNLSATPVFTHQYRIKKKDGTYTWMQSWNKIYKVDKEGNLEQLLGTALDISDKKSIESELIEAKEAAEKSDNLKSEFLAQMSHEIRTPLNVMMSYTSLLKDDMSDEDNAEQNEIFKSISNAGSRIIRTIDLILNSSELQAGSYSLIPKNVDLFNDIIMNVYNDLKGLIESKNIELSIRRSVNNSFVKCDEYSVYQSVMNLVDNAIKYTEEGFVEIRLKQSKEHKIQIEIEDSGIGISDEYQANLFKAFSQEESGYTRRFEGTGLGLSLVKNYCDLNNISIDFVSKKDRGTTFILTFMNS
jgi:PAS domain S-box-containing protein